MDKNVILIMISDTNSTNITFHATLFNNRKLNIPETDSRNIHHVLSGFGS